MLEGCRPEVRSAVRNITNVFACYDGGLAFVKFNHSVELIDKEATSGKENAEKLIAVILTFNQLLEAIAGGPLEKDGL